MFCGNQLLDHSMAELTSDRITEIHVSLIQIDLNVFETAFPEIFQKTGGKFVFEKSLEPDCQGFFETIGLPLVFQDDSGLGI